MSLAAGVASMAFYTALALINYGWVFLAHSIQHRWPMCMARLMLGIAIGKGSRK